MKIEIIDQTLELGKHASCIPRIIFKHTYTHKLVLCTSQLMEYEIDLKLSEAKKKKKKKENQRALRLKKINLCSFISYMQL